MSHRISLSTLRTNVRHHLDEATAAFWTNAQLLVYINQAIDRVWNEVRNSRGDYFFKSLASTAGSQTLLSETYAASSLQIAVGAIEITLPPDFAELKLIRVTTANYEHVRFTQSELIPQLVPGARSTTSVPMLTAVVHGCAAPGCCRSHHASVRGQASGMSAPVGAEQM